MGTTVGKIIFDIGGGVPDGKKFKAAQLGGPSGGCVAAEHLNLPTDYEAIAEVGAIMGSGGLIVMDEDTCMVDMARYFMDFCKDESCGKCTPCRVGTKRMLEVLERICKGQGRARGHPAARGSRQVDQGFGAVRAGPDGSQSGAEHAALLRRGIPGAHRGQALHRRRVRAVVQEHLPECLPDRHGYSGLHRLDPRQASGRRLPRAQAHQPVPQRVRTRLRQSLPGEVPPRAARRPAGDQAPQALHHRHRDAAEGHAAADLPHRARRDHRRRAGRPHRGPGTAQARLCRHRLRGAARGRRHAALGHSRVSPAARRPAPRNPGDRRHRRRVAHRHLHRPRHLPRRDRTPVQRRLSRHRRAEERGAAGGERRGARRAGRGGIPARHQPRQGGPVSASASPSSAAATRRSTRRELPSASARSR